MARLAAQAKALFYPTTPDTLSKLASILRFEAGSNVAEIACGDGRVLEGLFCGKELNIFGVELDEHRWGLSCETTKNERATILNACFLTETEHNCMMDFVFTNPPYDNIQDEHGSSRLELEFVFKALRMLKTGGTFITIVPIKTLRNDSFQKAISNLANLEIYKKTADIFSIFKQVVIIGRKTSVSPEKSKENGRWIQSFIYNSSLPNTSDMVEAHKAETNKIVIKPLKGGARDKFISTKIGMDELMGKTDLLKSQFLARVQADEGFRIMAPPNESHLAMLLVNGVASGVPFKMPDGRVFLIKGAVTQTEKKTVTAEEDKIVTTTHHSFKSKLVAYDVSNDQLIAIE